MRDGLAGEQADTRIVSAFGKVVANLELVFASAEFARNAGREVVRESQEYLRAERLNQRSPGLSGQRRFQ